MLAILDDFDGLIEDYQDHNVEHHCALTGVSSYPVGENDSIDGGAANSTPRSSQSARNRR